MTIKLIRLLQLLAYSMVASQVVFYLVVFSDALKLSSIENFLEHRRAVEDLVAHRYRMIYYTGLVCGTIAIIAAAKNPGSAFFISSCIALVCLIADTAIALKFNIPLNHLINTHGNDAGTVQWESIRDQWLDYFRYRGAFSALGMASLFIGLVIDKS